MLKLLAVYIVSSRKGEEIERDREREGVREIERGRG